MDLNLPVKTKKLWNIVRAILFMLKKGISKSKLKFELNLFMKRSKIARKDMISDLMFHHHKGDGPREYEFRFSNSPAHFFFHINEHHQHDQDEENIDEHDLSSLSSVNAVLERLNSDAFKLMASPMFPARQLRITDSPFPVQVEDDHGQVDRAADEFIKKFYRQLKQQRKMSKEDSNVDA